METTTDITTDQVNKFLQPEITEIAVIKTKKNETVSVQGSIVKVIHVLKKIISILDNILNIFLYNSQKINNGVYRQYPQHYSL